METVTEMTQERMMQLVSQLIEEAGVDDGPPGVTMMEIAIGQNPEADYVPHGLRRRIKKLIRDGLVGVRRGIRSNVLGEQCRKPVYYLTDAGRQVLGDLPVGQSLSNTSSTD